MHLALVFALLFLSLVPATAQSPDGSIRGTVLTADGSPVADAHVSAEVMRGNVIQKVLDANTNDNGTFVFTHLAMGDYRLSAEKQEAGYLSTRPDIFSSRSPLLVSLTSDTPTFSTAIRFAAKTAALSLPIPTEPSEGCLAAAAPIPTLLQVRPDPARKQWTVRPWLRRESLDRSRVEAKMMVRTGKRLQL